MTKCRSCRKPFTRVRPLQVACSPPCAHKLAVAAREKKAQAAAKEDRKATREALDAMKTVPQLHADCKSVFNRYVRLRDIRAGRGCISCGKPFRVVYGGAFDCGHYRSVGTAGHLRYHLHNAHLQCVSCNQYDAGARDAYRAALVLRIGLDKVVSLEENNSPVKWRKAYLRKLKRVFGKKARRQAARIEKGTP